MNSTEKTADAIDVLRADVIVKPGDCYVRVPHNGLAFIVSWNQLVQHDESVTCGKCALQTMSLNCYTLLISSDTQCGWKEV